MKAIFVFNDSINIWSAVPVTFTSQLVQGLAMKNASGVYSCFSYILSSSIIQSATFGYPLSSIFFLPFSHSLCALILETKSHFWQDPISLSNSNDSALVIWPCRITFGIWIPQQTLLSLWGMHLGSRKVWGASDWMKHTTGQEMVSFIYWYIWCYPYKMVSHWGYTYFCFRIYRFKCFLLESSLSLPFSRYWMNCSLLWIEPCCQVMIKDHLEEEKRNPKAQP